MGQILITIKTITQNFRQRLPEAFKPSYKTLIESLVPVVTSNLQYEELTSQILVFFQSNMIILGLEML